MEKNIDIEFEAGIRRHLIKLFKEMPELSKQFPEMVKEYYVG